MSNTHSGLVFTADATNGQNHHLATGVRIEGPFTSTRLILRFPRWVPGSYFLREPIQHMFDFGVVNQDEKELTWKRIDVDGIAVNVPKSVTSLKITYTLFAKELSVRSNHLDSTHLHLMPPFTWFLPVQGIDLQRLDQTHQVEITAPETWTPGTQLDAVENSRKGDARIWKFTTPNRDYLLDSIIEVNPNEPIEYVVNGRVHRLKWWDSGGHIPHQERLQAFVDDTEKIVKEHFALFGTPDWPDYTTVLHLTEKARGGLEHMNSQTSMMPRQCLFPHHEDEYRDLVSLFSHEYLHQWNVKRLRPKNFLDYDLQKETHTDLLWWFEGGTSWLGDMLCVRSGAWTEEDWRKDFARKMKRHMQNNGMTRESLAESSHDAWIHLYRSGPYTRESQISYYLEGELALMCLDVELRRRSKGEFGACNLIAEVCRRFSLGADSPDGVGVDYTTIRDTLKQVPGGKSMGPYLDRLVKHRHAPNILHALKYFRLQLAPDVKDTEEKAWLGISTRDNNGSVQITTYHSDSPMREVSEVGDELLAIDSVRIRSTTHLQRLMKGRVGDTVNLEMTHEGILREIHLKLPSSPRHGVMLKGKGNARWTEWITTRQATEN